MSDEGTRTSRMSWIASVFHPERMIAAPTIAALKAILTGRKASSTAVAHTAGSEAPAVRLAELPELGEVGGIARITVDSGEQVGVARVGRNSFVGYRLEDEVLREIEITLDETGNELRIVPAPA